MIISSVRCHSFPSILYLNDIVHDVILDPPPVENSVSLIKDVTMQTSDDYVWDVFYHRPATLSEWNEAANIATLYVVSHCPFVKIHWFSFRSGLPVSVVNSYESASESEEEDEADEDSNGSFSSLPLTVPNNFYLAEEYYKNDYPDEDDTSSGSGKSAYNHFHNRYSSSMQMSFMNIQIVMMWWDVIISLTASATHS